MLKSYCVRSLIVLRVCFVNFLFISLRFCRASRSDSGTVTALCFRRNRVHTLCEYCECLQDFCLLLALSVDGVSSPFIPNWVQKILADQKGQVPLIDGQTISVEIDVAR